METYYHCSSALLRSGSIIEPGNWGRIIRKTGWAHNQSAREVILEHVRQASFPSSPSRLESAFFFDDENEARFYANSDGREFTMVPYEVELLDPAAPRHASDWRNVVASGPLDLTWAHQYWQGQMLPPFQGDLWAAACREMIAITPMRIVKRLV